MCRTTQQENMKTFVICTGVVWLASTAAIGLSMLFDNKTICKLTA